MTRKRALAWTIAALLMANEIRGVILVATIGPPILKPMVAQIQEGVKAWGR